MRQIVFLFGVMALAVATLTFFSNHYVEVWTLQGSVIVDTNPFIYLQGSVLVVFGVLMIVVSLMLRRR